MYRLSRSLILYLMLTAVIVGQAAARDMILQAELWAELEPFLSEGESASWDAEQAALRLLETAAFVFAGMTYGFNVRYVPAEPLRGVREQVDVVPRAAIVRGDRGLRTRQIREADGRIYGVFSFHPDEVQSSSRLRFLRSDIARSEGMGTADYFAGPVAVQEAIQAAVAHAVLAEARRVTANRPAEIVADAVLIEAPLVSIRSGEYTARVRVSVQFREIRAYELF
ncbi:MAG: hypothetical protein EA383_01030 [Spirochaetaceae bacterium]|nr:MAG: hypothetical protein EA383_01030 [Spirochaetaceae bacterium]